MVPGALDDLLVIDLAQEIGAYCTKLLADLGATVVKLEPPGGDPERARDPSPWDGRSARPGLRFGYLNSAKTLEEVDLETAAGRARLALLLGDADVVVESLTASAAAAANFDYPSAGTARPTLVWLSLTPFGRTGPYAPYLADDLVLQAASGWMFEGGEPTREPLKTGGEISHYVTGTWGALAVVAAWTHVEAGGSGQHVDLSAMEALQSTAGYWALAKSFGASGSPGRTGQGYPLGIMPCADGYVGINILTPAQGRNWTIEPKPRVAQFPAIGEPACA